MGAWCQVCGSSKVSRVRLTDDLCQTCCCWFDSVMFPPPASWVAAKLVEARGFMGYYGRGMEAEKVAEIWARER